MRASVCLLNVCHVCCSVLGEALRSLQFCNFSVLKMVLQGATLTHNTEDTGSKPRVDQKIQHLGEVCPNQLKINQTAKSCFAVCSLKV